MIIHSSLTVTSATSKYRGYHEAQLEEVNEDLAELIERGGQTKRSLLSTIDNCKVELKQAAQTIENKDNELELTSAEIRDKITKNHIEPLLESREEDIKSSLDDMIEDMVKKRMAHQEKSINQTQEMHNEQKKAQLAEQEQQTMAKTNGPSEAESENTELMAESHHQTSIKNKHILIVEDIELYREMLVKVLADECFEVSSACDGVDALKKIQQHHYDCILMDLFLPKMDGFHTTQQIKKASGGKEIPVIALASNTDQDLIRKWVALGLKGYIIKPSTRPEILGAVNKALG